MGTISETDFIEKLSKLKSLLFQFDQSHDEEKKHLLNELIIYNSFKHQTFKQFHQVLMG